jgi:hypothetical protein
MSYFCLIVHANCASLRLRLFPESEQKEQFIKAKQAAKAKSEGVYHLLQPFGYFRSAMCRMTHFSAAFRVVHQS